MLASEVKGRSDVRVCVRDGHWDWLCVERKQPCLFERVYLTFRKREREADSVNCFPYFHSQQRVVVFNLIWLRAKALGVVWSASRLVICSCRAYRAASCTNAIELNAPKWNFWAETDTENSWCTSPKTDTETKNYFKKLRNSFDLILLITHTQIK